eukprot:6182262-Pleurochrysis_carterae.AAC.2
MAIGAAASASASRVACSNLSTMGRTTSTQPFRSAAAVYDRPFSHARVSSGSRGTRPRNGTLNAAAMASAPPRADGNTSYETERGRSSGQRAAMSSSACALTSAPLASRKLTAESGASIPAMFSMTPSTFSFVLAQKDSSFRTSIRLTSCGVETITAPSRGPITLPRYCTSEMCSSDVPGGVSMSR